MMNRWLLILLTLIYLLFAKNSYAQTATLETKVNQVLTQEGLVGVSWALVDGDKSTLGASGLSNQREQTKLTTQHKTHVGSITKTVMATGVLALVSAGKLQLESKVSDILPMLELVNPWRETDPVTVAHLLDHTAGIQDARFWHLVNTQAQVDSPLATVFLKDTDLLEVKVRPGSQFAYSNLGYNLLAMVIEAVTAQRYEDALQHYLLKPLKMSDSTMAFTSQAGPFKDERLTYGHLDHGQLFAAVPSYLRAAGQFTTTVADMEKFIRFLLGNGVQDGKVVVDAELLAQMGQPAEVAAYQAGLHMGGSKGLWRRDRNQTLGLCHGGNTAGFKGMLCLYPEQDKAFFVMANTDSETANYELLNKLMVEELQVASPEPITVQAYDASDWYGWYAPTIYRYGKFTYLDKIFSTYVLKPRGEQLVFGSAQSADYVLSSLGNGLYAQQQRVSPSHILMRSADGTPMISNGFNTYKMVDKLGVIGLGLSLALGLSGALYILLYGGYVFVARFSKLTKEPLAIAFTMYLAYLLCVPFFINQSFIHIGDINAASVLLAFASVFAPVVCVIACVVHIRQKQASTLSLLALVAFVQWMVVMGFWGLIPLTLWNV
ncbi:serine hydrolase domain-containing protein [Pseudoalteromonas sp. MMG022]|uniref:serine hydrolase domain-containing protein n=1 Tax=Pseudoalteromonas sp. MMG022 TaxID=2909978 RepID=UPI001F232D32|nr:serine hydrolase domain-containing protein [Pseudoalteromonas sp. MMG022]MCF6434839.1 beta-lactamase family protein [Pseudoalteromonas sp. MMG022]